MVDLSAIRDGMEVISSDGELVGAATGVEGGRIGVRTADGLRHVDADRVSRVDDHVHLRDSAAVVRGDWSGAPIPREDPTAGRAKGPWIVGLVFLVILVLLLIWGLLYMFGGAGNDRTEPLPITGQGEGSLNQQ
jgi:hypothetical protein